MNISTKAATRLGVAIGVVVVLLATSSIVRRNVEAAEPVVTSDIVLVAEDSYGLGDRATLAIRNDGDVPYVYHQIQQGCYFTYKDAAGRAFQIPPATHCDLPQETQIAPGQTVTVLTGWSLDECTIPGFFCFSNRPLPSGDYTISGSLNSADVTKRAEFSKTISITGPTFTSDITAAFGGVVSDPPAGVPPVFLELFNHGSVNYAIGPDPCFLQFHRPDGHLFLVPRSYSCVDDATHSLAAGSSLRAFTDWKLDECTQSGQNGACLTAVPLPPGVYTVTGALWSAGGASYAEFSASYTVFAAPSPSPKVTPVGLPRDGGPPGTGGGARPGALALGIVLALAGGAVLGSAIRAGRRLPRSR